MIGSTFESNNLPGGLFDKNRLSVFEQQRISTKTQTAILNPVRGGTHSAIRGYKQQSMQASALPSIPFNQNTNVSSSMQSIKIKKKKNQKLSPDMRSYNNEMAKNINNNLNQTTQDFRHHPKPESPAMGRNNYQLTKPTGMFGSMQTHQNSDPNLKNFNAIMEKGKRKKSQAAPVTNTGGNKIILKKINKFFDNTKVEKQYKAGGSTQGVSNLIHSKQSLNLKMMSRDEERRRIFSPGSQQVPVNPR